CLVADRARDAVRTEHDGGSFGNVGELVDEHGAALPEVVDDVAIVDDLVTHVDRRAEARQRLLDDGDRAIDTGAEPPRAREYDFGHALRGTAPVGLFGGHLNAPRRHVSPAIRTAGCRR